MILLASCIHEDGMLSDESGKINLIISLHLQYHYLKTKIIKNII